MLKQCIDPYSPCNRGSVLAKDIVLHTNGVGTGGTSIACRRASAS
jgi:hypothetical protein